MRKFYVRDPERPMAMFGSRDSSHGQNVSEKNAAISTKIRQIAIAEGVSCHARIVRRPLDQILSSCTVLRRIADFRRAARQTLRTAI